MNKNIPDSVWEKIGNIRGRERAEFCLISSLEQFKSGNYEAAYILSSAAADIYMSSNESPFLEGISESLYGVFNSLRHLGRLSLIHI